MCGYGCQAGRMETVIVLHCDRAFACLGVPESQAVISIAAAGHDAFPIWQEAAAPNRATVTCQHLRRPRLSGVLKGQMSNYTLAHTSMQAPVFAFHSQAVKSSEPTSSRSPLGCHCSHSMPSVGPSSTLKHAPLEASHILTTPACSNCFDLRYCALPPSSYLLSLVPTI